MRVFVDSDVLIWHLRGQGEAKRLLGELLEREDLDLWIGAMQRAEIVFFMRDEEEKTTLDLLSLLKTDTIDQAIVDLPESFLENGIHLTGLTLMTLCSLLQLLYVGERSLL